MEHRGGYIYKRILGVLSLMLLSISTLFGCGQDPARAFYGSFVTSVDISPLVCERVDEWMDTALMREFIDSDDIITDIELELEVSFDREGNWNQSVVQQSYEKCKNVAFYRIENLVKELLILRINAAGEGEYSDDELNALVQETIGMSLSDYVREYIADAMPSLDELRTTYDSHGIYEVDGNVLIRDGMREEFIAGDNSIVLTKPLISGFERDIEYPLVLIRSDNSEEEKKEK